MMKQIKLFHHLFLYLNKRNTIIVVTHEMNFAREVASEVMFMADGHVVEQGVPQEVFLHPQQQRTQDFLYNML